MSDMARRGLLGEVREGMCWSEEGASRLLTLALSDAAGKYNGGQRRWRPVRRSVNLVISVSSSSTVSSSQTITLLPHSSGHLPWGRMIGITGRRVSRLLAALHQRVVVVVVVIVAADRDGGRYRRGSSTGWTEVRFDGSMGRGRGRRGEPRARAPLHREGDVDHVMVAAAL